jgi:hypothetical protein
MRLRLLPLVLMVGACVTTERWTKTGADDALTQTDTEECQAIAKQEAQRRYPYMSGAGPYGSTGMILSQQQDNANRSSVQVSAFNECMQRKGYARTSSS